MGIRVVRREACGAKENEILKFMEAKRGEGTEVDSEGFIEVLAIKEARGLRSRRARRRRCLEFECCGKMLLAGMSVVEERRKENSDVPVHAMTGRERGSAERLRFMLTSVHEALRKLSDVYLQLEPGGRDGGRCTDSSRKGETVRVDRGQRELS